MPRSRRRLSRPSRPNGKRRNWRLTLIAVLTGWNRYQVARVIGGVLLVWVVGAVALYVVEGHANPAFDTMAESLWSVWVLLFSGLDEAPKSPTGRLIAMVLLVAGVGLAGLFTASVASLLVERYLRRRDVSNFEMDDHLVLCNWAPRGLEWIREVHGKIITEPRPIVIIHDTPDEIDLPDKVDEPAFNDVYIVKGDPTNEVVLHRATVAKAYSVVILSDGREGKHADGKSYPDLHRHPAYLPVPITSPILLSSNATIQTIDFTYKKAGRPTRSSHLILWGCISWHARRLFHGMTQFYRELLTVRRDNNRGLLSCCRRPRSWSGVNSPKLGELLPGKYPQRSPILLLLSWHPARR